MPFVSNPRESEAPKPAALAPPAFAILNILSIHVRFLRVLTWMNRMGRIFSRDNQAMLHDRALREKIENRLLVVRIESHISGDMVR